MASQGTGSLSQAAISQDRPVSISPPRSRDRSHSRQQNREKDIASEFVSLVEGPTLSLSILCQDFSAQDAGTQEVCGSAELFGVQESKIAAKKKPIEDVALLLGHRKGSSSTHRYVQNLDQEEMAKRLIMTS